MIPTFFRPHLLALFISAALLWVNPSFAGSATWNLNPVDGNWNNASNWTPNTIPNGTDDVATFGISNKTAINVGINDPTETVSEIVFNPGASPYTITVPHVLDTVLYFAITGAGISNNSGTIQNLVAADYFATIFFTGEASAGSDTAILAGGRTSGLLPGQVEFLDDATAGSATVTANHGVIMFNNHSTAANATLIAEAGPTNVGGEIEFRENSMGGLARVIVNGNGTISQTNGVLDLTQHAPTPTLAIGSLEGNGEVLLYSFGTQFHDLIVGGNNLSTTFGGVIHGFNVQGTLYKKGRGTLTLAGSNLHGGTVIDGGAVLTRNTAGSATGLGPVTVNRGKLGGTGIIAGAVTVGAKPGSPATLTPGNSSTLGTLTLQSSLTFSGNANYDCAVNSSRIDSDKVIAQGVTIQSGQISLVDNGTGVLPAGTTFTLIDNTAAGSISGTFPNLVDQSAVILGNNTYRVSYEGGDGNDLTLTVLSP